MHGGFQMKKAILLFIILFAASFALAAADTGKVLFEQKCEQCHSLERSL